MMEFTFFIMHAISIPEPYKNFTANLCPFYGQKRRCGSS